MDARSPDFASETEVDAVRDISLDPGWRGARGEPAARPKSISVLTDMPVTPVGKIYKPALRVLATKRVIEETLRGILEDASSGKGADEDDEGVVLRAIKAAGRFGGRPCGNRYADSGK